MTPKVTFAVPGSLDTPTGGYAYDKRVVAELRARGCDVAVVDLGAGFPYPNAEARVSALAALRRITPDRVVIVDGLALGVLPETAESLRRTHRVVGLVHHPLAFESGLGRERTAAFLASERAALAGVRHVVVTSDATAALLRREYQVAGERISVARPGFDRLKPVEQRIGRGSGAPVQLLSVGSLVPRKGYDLLLQALAEVAELPWHLTIVGDPSRDSATAEALAAQTAVLGLAARVSFAGAVPAEDMAHYYAGADVFVLPSRFEGYGMAFAEAIGFGLPVIGTAVSAVPETVPPEAGILVPPENAGALAAALRRLLSDEPARRAYAEGARRAAARLPTWNEAADVFIQVIKGVA